MEYFRLDPEEVGCLVKTARSNWALDRDEGNGELVKVSESMVEDLKSLLSHPSKINSKD